MTTMVVAPMMSTDSSNASVWSRCRPKTLGTLGSPMAKMA